MKKPVDVASLLKVKKYRKIKLPSSKSFAQYFEKNIEPQLFKFSGKPADVPWTLVWARFREEVHVLHKKVASAKQKMQALAKICVSPAKEIISPLLMDNSHHGYKQLLRFMFASFGYAADEKHRIRTQIMTHSPGNLDSPRANYKYVQDMRGLYHRFVALGETPNQAANDVMRGMMKKLNPDVSRDYFIRFCVNEDDQDTFFESSPQAALEHFSNYALSNLLRKASARGENIIVADEEPPTAVAAVSHSGSTSHADSPGVCFHAQGSVNQGSGPSSSAGSTPKSSGAVKMENSTSQAEIQSQVKSNTEEKDSRKGPSGCSFCFSKDHFTWTCPLSVPERKERLKLQNKCFNCMKVGCKVATCPKPSQCKHCANPKVKHISFICGRKNTEGNVQKNAVLVIKQEPSAEQGSTASTSSSTTSSGSANFAAIPPLFPFPPPPLFQPSAGSSASSKSSA
jgi:hypothetical protein